ATRHRLRDARSVADRWPREAGAADAARPRIPGGAARRRAPDRNRPALGTRRRAVRRPHAAAAHARRHRAAGAARVPAPPVVRWLSAHQETSLVSRHLADHTKRYKEEAATWAAHRRPGAQAGCFVRAGSPWVWPRRSP